MSGGSFQRLPEVPAGDWPVQDCEAVDACPVCGSDCRRVLHRDLEDRTFFTAPGRWTLHGCVSCGAAYLDPRPTPESIHRAYEDYHTHEAPAVSLHERPKGARRVLRALGNGYRNWRYGTALRPANALGAALLWLFPGRRAAADALFRDLPKAWPGGRLLDVGFGDGSFLEAASAAGWRASGVDFDAATVDSARARGLDAHWGSIDAYRGCSELFDVITMSHVIEHVHEPAALLENAYRLLKPGGRLWLETPNLESLGHRKFGRHWRGLETPRHLVLFNWHSLTLLLRQAGFGRIRRRFKGDIYPTLSVMSEAIARGADPSKAGKPKLNYRLGGRLVDLRARFQPRVSEFITLEAYKPDEPGSRA